MTKRLFVAIDLPESTKQFLVDLDPKIHGVRWAEATQMHLTLGFFSDVPEFERMLVRSGMRCVKNSAQSSLERFFYRSSASAHFRRMARRKLFGSASVADIRIFSRCTSACRKPRWPLASSQSCAPGIRTLRSRVAEMSRGKRFASFWSRMSISMRE